MTKYSQTLKPTRNCNFKKHLKKISKSALLFLMVGLFVSSMVVYLAEVNNIAAKGFQVRDLENQIEKLASENEKLQVQAIEMRSMTDLSTKVQELGMVPVNDITYYDTTGQLVAVR